MKNSDELDSVQLRQIFKNAKAHGLAYVDVEPFLSASYDPQEYANAIIDANQGTAKRSADSGSNGDWMPQAGRVDGDLSVALGRLNVVIDDVQVLIRDEISQNASALLGHTITTLNLRPTVDVLKSSLAALEAHQAKLTARISDKHALLSAQVKRLQRLRSAQVLIKQAQRFVRLLRRLQGQVQALNQARLPALPGGEGSVDEKVKLERLGEEDAEDEAGEADEVFEAEAGEQTGRSLSRAAITISEIFEMLKDTSTTDASAISLRQLSFVQDCMPTIEDARERVTDLMEEMVVRGLRDLSPTLLSTSLQTSFNLGQLTELVRDLLADLTDVIRDRTQAAFDMQVLARELGSKEPQAPSSTTYRARKGEFSTALHQRWTSAVWQRLQSFILGEMGAVCSKVYTLERVLSLKMDKSSGRTYLDLAVEVLGEQPSSMFWATLAKAIDEEIEKLSSPFLLQLLEQGYPRLLHLFQDFYAKVSVYTGTIYTHTQQSQEAHTIQSSLSRFELAFLSKVKSRFEHLLSVSFTAQNIPSSKEAQVLLKMALSDLDAANVDPLLFRAVGKIVLECLDKAHAQIVSLIAKDPSVQSMQNISPSQIRNATLTGALHQFSLGLQRAIEQSPSEFNERLTQIQVRVDATLIDNLVEPMIKVVSREISQVMSRMHYVDFGLERDAVSGSGSAYMAELCDRLWFVREQLFVHYDLPTGAWLIRIAKHALQTFVVHASLIRPLAEGGKLKLTSDMTELEFGVSQLLASARHGGGGSGQALSMQDCGKQFKALRSFRHLLFTNLQTWAPTNDLRTGLPAVVAAHHVIARSISIALPHELHKWTYQEYVKWLDGHSEQDAVQLVQGCLDVWQQQRQAKEQKEEASDIDDNALAQCLERVIIASKEGVNETSPQKS